jgi:protein-L-isoaspartate(D-aspartate) O-methyltransferase
LTGSGDPASVMQLILSLRARGVTDPQVLTAIETTPRERFLDGTFRARAHEDTALPIACGQTISQPTVVGLMTQALDLDRRMKVLEVGTGSGYQAAILARLARRVYSIERHPALARSATRLLADLGLSNVTVIAGDGALGLPDQAPFDRIIVTAAAEDVPPNLIHQLRAGGIMVLPVGQTDTVQTLLKVVKTDQGLDYHSLGDVRFVPLVEGFADDSTGH